MKIIKIKGVSFINKSGRLIKRKNHLRNISTKITLSSAKNRVKSLNQALEKLRQLTLKDPNNLEYATTINKRFKTSNTPILKGFITDDNIHVVDMPKQSKRKWTIHSHPDNSPLSIQDIIVTPKKQSIFNVTLDGSIYRATPLKSEQEISRQYNELLKKIKSTGIVPEINNKYYYLNPNVDKSILKKDLNSAIQHKILQALDKKGFIKYRSKIKPGTQRVYNRYTELNDIELKKYFNNIEFNKQSKYYISPSKWNKIPKSKRMEIRRREKKYGNNYNLAVRRDKRLKQLYREIGIK